MKREQLIIVEDASGRVDPNALEAFHKAITESIEKEEKHIVVGSQSGRLSPEALEELAKVSQQAMIHDINSALQVVVGQPNTPETREDIIERLNDSMNYPAPLYQNREARRKAAKEEKRKNRRMF